MRITRTLFRYYLNANPTDTIIGIARVLHQYSSHIVRVFQQYYSSIASILLQCCSNIARLKLQNSISIDIEFRVHHTVFPTDDI